MSERCGSKHKFSDQTCIRPKGHDGFCQGKTERMADASLMYCEWESRDGKFYSHVGYVEIHPRNAVR